MAVKKTQMYRRNLDGTETNLNPLTESQYVLMENGQTVQEVLSDRDSDKYTPVITNSSSTFKVGQGDNVDLSSSMKEGAYDSCVLKGKTMVNCIQEPSSKDVVLPYEFEDGHYVTINDTKESGALGVELKGQTLVNLVGEKREYSSAGLYGWEFMLPYKLIQNEKYMVIFNASGTITSNSKVYLMDNGFGNNSGNTPYPVSFTLGYNKHITTASGANHKVLRIRTDSQAVNDLKVSDVMLIPYQEGMENWDIPYFEGMTSCKMPILKSVGKNLFDNSTTQKYYTSSDGVWTSSNNNRSTDFIRVKGDCKYHAKCFVSGAGNPAYAWFDANKNFIKRDNHQGGVVTSPSNAHYVKAHVGNIDTELTNENFLMTVSQTNTQITEHKNYKSSILSLPEEIVLRSLPNGVCDTFNTRTGVYTQRIKEVSTNDVVNSTTWGEASALTTSNNIAFYYKENNIKTVSGGSDGFGVVIADGLSCTNRDSLMQDIEGLASSNKNIIFKILKSKLPSSLTVNDFKAWLRANPMTIQYELATPIITKINLSSTLKSWNTTTHIYSEIPQNTLYPILSHSNPTYPVILKPSTKYSIVANSYSNNHTNSAINFNLGGATASTTVGNRVTTITTPSTLSNELLTMSGRGNKLNNVMVIEGDVVGDEPYFEGMCDSKSPILSNIGKNLFDLNQALDVNNWVAYPNKPYRSIAFKVKPKTTYSLSCSANVNVGNKGYFGIFPRGGYYATEDGGWNTSLHWGQSSGVTKTTFTTLDQEVYYMSLYFDSGFTQDNVTNFFTNRVVDIQIEEASAKTAYEPYKSNTTTFNQKDDKTIVLRSLPSGVYDTLNVETGEYVQRIGEVVLDGSYIAYSNQSDGGYPSATSTAVLLNLKSSEPPQNRIAKFVCKDLPHYSASDSIWMGGTPVNTGISGVSGSWDFCIRLPYTVTGGARTDSNDVIRQKFKDYLNENPVTVQYELATPIVSTIDVQGFPYAYTNGHVQLSSGSIEQSLTPKVEYSLSANKTGQINSNTKRVSAHQKQLDDFEAMMLTQMVQSAYDKAILQFDYEMQMMSLGGE